MKREPVCFRLLCFFFWIFIVSSVIPGVAADNLYFGVFISQDSDFDFSGFIPPLQLGVDTINNNTNILGNYFIEYEPIANAKVIQNTSG